MSRVKNQTTRLLLQCLESRDVPAVFNIPNGDVTALAAAIVTANGNAEADTINLATNGTYTVTTPVVDGTAGDSAFAAITTGGGALTINANGSVIERSTTAANFRLFRVNGGTLILGNATIRNGVTGFIGGGLRVDSGGSMTVYNSTISANSSSFGGSAIGVLGTSDLTLVNVTVTENVLTTTIAPSGGAILSGFSGQASILDFANVTIAGNTSFTSGRSAGVAVEGGTGLITNSVIANNVAAGAATNVVDASRSAGTVDVFYSLIRTPGTAFASGSSSNNLAAGTDPLLGTPATNGGPTFTMLPQTGSPLINGGDNAQFNNLSSVLTSALTTDQRGTGFARIANTTIDIGAVEVQPTTTSTTTTLTSARNPSLFREPVTFVAVVTPASGGPATGTVTFRNGSEVLGTVALVNGQASFTTTALNVRSNSITAVYNPTGAFTTSTSAPVLQVVNPRTTSIALSVPASLPGSIPTSIGFTVTVDGASAPPPSGFATLFVDGVAVSTVRVTSNTGNFVVTLGVGVKSLRVQFIPDAGFLGSTSSTVVVTTVSTTPSGLPSLPNTERVVGRRWRR